MGAGCTPNEGFGIASIHPVDANLLSYCSMLRRSYNISSRIHALNRSSVKHAGRSKRFVNISQGKWQKVYRVSQAEGGRQGFWVNSLKDRAVVQTFPRQY